MKGVWQRGRLRLPVKQLPQGQGGSKPSAPTTPPTIGPAQLAERRPPKRTVCGSTRCPVPCLPRRSRWPKATGCKPDGESPTPSRFGPSSPGLVSSVDESSQLRLGGWAGRVVTRHRFLFPMARAAALTSRRLALVASRPRTQSRTERAARYALCGLPHAGTSFSSVWRGWQRA